APLAFLWLVLGFLQQGHELRNSADALWIQSRELQHSVEQQRQLVDVTREQLAFESEMLRHQQEEIRRNSQPVIRLAVSRISTLGGKKQVTFALRNHGKPCTAIAIH